MKIVNVVGARPNFMKMAPLIEEMRKHRAIEQVLVHTGQHYDKNMSKLFFTDLNLPKPDIYLEVGSGSHAEQTAKIMFEFEKVLLRLKPDLVVVVGDVNSTIACALVAAKLHIKIAHVEAGLRSFDRTMPEEINRVLTDAISDYLFITEKDAETNLMNEGRSKKDIFFTGNVMIDTLISNRRKAGKSKILEKLGLKERDAVAPSPYALLTLHRPSNVDNREILAELFEVFECIQKRIKIIYPVHPRTQKRIKEFGLDKKSPFLAVPPLGYIDFLHLMDNAKFVLTDSGGIQEETTVLGIPCITLRENTERPVTVTHGTNTITGTDRNRIIGESLNTINGNVKAAKIPELWDGKAAKRIVNILLKVLRK